MKVVFKSSFVKDLERIRDGNVRKRVLRVVEEVEKARTFEEVRNLKKLRGKEGYYRIRVGDYRIGLTFRTGEVAFVRILHRRDLYRYFP